jgi:hypothetical protein
MRRALLCAFIDHFSRCVCQGSYYLHEDFAALRFGFRRPLLAHGRPGKLYVDSGASYQASRFHAACDALEIKLVHSKPYRAEGRGVIERFNRTLKRQFEAEVREREELLLDELNAYFEAWLAERYHRDVHSETGEAPAVRFASAQDPRAAPEPELLDELLRLRERRSVHKKWSTVEVDARRYLVDPALRSRRVDLLYNPFAPAYVPVPPQPEPPAAPSCSATDYLALLRADFEKRAQEELSALRLRPARARTELPLPELVSLLEACRGCLLSPDERTRTSALWRKLRPLDPALVRDALATAQRRLGLRFHLDVYLEHLQSHVVRLRSKGEKPRPWRSTSASPTCLSPRPPRNLRSCATPPCRSQHVCTKTHRHRGHRHPAAIPP